LEYYKVAYVKLKFQNFTSALKTYLGDPWVSPYPGGTYIPGRGGCTLPRPRVKSFIYLVGGINPIGDFPCIQ